MPDVKSDGEVSSLDSLKNYVVNVPSVGRLGSLPLDVAAGIVEASHAIRNFEDDVESIPALGKNGRRK